MSLVHRGTAGILVALMAVLCAAHTRARPLPLWELGLGVSVLTAPDYIGSDERRNWIVPIPYFVYRGHFLRVDRNAVRGRLFSTDRLELAVSASGTIPVDSKNNRARKGMPDLDFSGEVGPRLRWLLYRFKARDRRIYLDLPVRAVFASDFTFLNHIGWTSSPAFSYAGNHASWNIDAGAGVEFADSSYNGYFYGVDRKFATPERGAYRAGGGYAGARFVLGVSRRFGRFWVGAFTRYVELEGATFQGSPLVRSHYSLIGGLAMAWVFFESSALVDSNGVPSTNPETTSDATIKPQWPLRKASENQ